MEPAENYAWIEQEIQRLKTELSSRDFDVYELDLLNRTAAKAAGFCPECTVCQDSLEALSCLLKNVADPSRMKGDVLKNYSKTFRSVVRHLEENHGIVRRGAIMRGLIRGLLLGALPGIVAGVAGIAMQDDVVVAIGFGALFLGVLLGIWLGLRAGQRRSTTAEAEDRFL